MQFWGRIDTRISSGLAVDCPRQPLVHRRGHPRWYQRAHSSSILPRWSPAHSVSQLPPSHVLYQGMQSSTPLCALSLSLSYPTAWQYDRCRVPLALCPYSSNRHPARRRYEDDRNALFPSSNTRPSGRGWLAPLFEPGRRYGPGIRLIASSPAHAAQGRSEARRYPRCRERESDDRGFVSNRQATICYVGCWPFAA